MNRFVLNPVYAARYVLVEAKNSPYYEHPHHNPENPGLYIIFDNRPCVGNNLVKISNLMRTGVPDNANYMTGVMRELGVVTKQMLINLNLSHFIPQAPYTWSFIPCSEAFWNNLEKHNGLFHVSCDGLAKIAIDIDSRYSAVSSNLFDPVEIKELDTNPKLATSHFDVAQIAVLMTRDFYSEVLEQVGDSAMAYDKLAQLALKFYKEFEDVWDDQWEEAARDYAKKNFTKNIHGFADIVYHWTQQKVKLLQYE